MSPIGPSGKVASTPGASITHKFAFTFATAGLNTGVPIGLTPAIGDYLEDAWVEIDTAFDGTTPFIDVGGFSGSNLGWFGGINAVIDATLAGTVLIATGLLSGSGSNGAGGVSLLSLSAMGATPPNAGFRYVPAKFTSAIPVLLVLSQNGQKSGTATGSTVGAGVVYVRVNTPA